MKPNIKLSLIIVGLLVLLVFTEGLNLYFPFTSCSRINKADKSESDSINGTISISGAFALYPLTVKWAEEFKKLHPKVQIDVSAGGAGKGMTDVLSGMVDLAMFSREVNPMETQKGALAIAVAQDAVFPTLNTSNPEYQTIMKMGLTRDQFTAIFTTAQNNWSHYLNKNSATKINVYTRSDACGAAATWASYFNQQQENLLGTGVFGDPGMADAVIKDPLGLGYNNLVYLYSLKTDKCNPGICAIPIDLNGNRIIDNEENFYGTMHEVIEAIQTGKYPAPPARKLYLISKGIPENKAVNAFLQFVLQQGQNYVSLSGYVNLPNTDVEVQLSKIGY